MAAAYLVKVPDTGGQTLKNGANALIVYADSATDAKAVAKARFGGDSDALWAAATVTAIAAGADLEGWRLHIVVYDGTDTVDVTVTGAAAATVDTIGALAVTALNATTPIAGAAYNSGTNVLTIAETTDGLGDKAVLAEFLPPANSSWTGSAAIPSFVTTVVDEGASGAALSCVLVQSTIPAVYGSVAVLG
jgi:hypothetical protein